ncbi:MAG: restriction endonuclease subunit S [Bacteroidaceae bacterium]|nr:restriction endonuclease subunit S [Bacteroidaceae bacterium]
MEERIKERFGELPSGWVVKKLKDIFDINELSLPSNTPPDYQFKYIPIEQISTNHIEYAGCDSFIFSESPGRARRIVREGDILISGVRPNLKAFAVFKKPDNNNWICSTGFFVLTAKAKEDSMIAYYELLSDICGSQFYSYVAGTNYPAIGDSDIRNMRIILPSSKAEKSAIANILSKVDEAIESVQHSITMAERLKKSLMQNLLTGKMKPDGTFRKPDEFYVDEKFGKVPVGWEVKKVQDLSILVTDGEHQTPERTDNGFYLLSARNIKNGYLSLEDVDYIPEKELIRIQKRCNPQAGDILISCSGTIGNVCIVPDDFVGGMVRSAALVKLKKDMIDSQFAELMFQSHYLQNQMKVAVASSVQGNIFQGAIRKLRLYYPKNKNERNAISECLCQFNTIISSKQQQIAVLEHLKKSLMQNLLTGKIRIES